MKISSFLLQYFQSLLHYNTSYKVIPFYTYTHKDEIFSIHVTSSKTKKTNKPRNVLYVYPKKQEISIPVLSKTRNFLYMYSKRTGATSDNPYTIQVAVTCSIHVLKSHL